MAVGFRKGAKMARMEAALANPSKALKQIGALMVAESQEAFVDQRFGTSVWPPRGKVNVFGVIADMAGGKSAPPARRFQTRPALRDTGRLAASITFRVSGKTVSVGSNLPYADAHHRGLEVKSETITKQVQTVLWEWLQDQSAERRKQLGWLLNRKFRDTKLSMKLPERPLVGITKQTIADVEEVVGVTIFEVK